jgi:hypothetical protein
VLGFISDRLYVMPHASGRGAKDPAWLHRLYLEAAERWELPSGAAIDEAGRIFRSDTGQLVLDREGGVFTANAPCARIAMGSLGDAGALDLGDVTISCRTPFASVSVVSLDGQPIGTSSRLLITAVARAENTGQAFLDNHSAIPEWGRVPVLGEPVAATVTIRTAGSLKAWPLTARGQRGEAGRVPMSREEGETVIDLAGAQSPWVLVAGQ